MHPIARMAADVTDGAVSMGRPWTPFRPHCAPGHGMGHVMDRKTLMENRYRIPSLAALNAFVAFARTGAIRRAAAELRIDHAAVSRHLRDLEHALGVPLRTGQGGLTPQAEIYCARIIPLLEGLAHATADMRQDIAHLTVTCSHGFAYHWLLPRLSAFRRDHPCIDLLLRPVDADTGFDPRHGTGALHADIRYMTDEPQGQGPQGPEYRGAERNMRCMEITRPAVFPVASPRCLARLSHPPRTAADLLDAPLLLEDDETEWKLWFAAQSVQIGTVPAAGRLWQAHLALAAARAGEGIALGNPYLLAEDLRAGLLCPVTTTATPLRRVALGSYVLRAPAHVWEGTALRLLRTWLSAQVAIYEGELQERAHPGPET